MKPKLYPTTADAESANTLGTTASPLLAGFSIALIGLVAGNTRPLDAFLWPDVTLVFLMGAVMLFVLSVQFTVKASEFNLTQEEREKRTPKLADDQRQRGYGQAMETFAIWIARARLSFNVGFGLLLLGLVGVLLPPMPCKARLIAIGVAILFFLGEAMWIVTDFIQSRQLINSLKQRTDSSSAADAARTAIPDEPVPENQMEERAKKPERAGGY